ncbi:MAG: hypothetical protein U1F20_03880 [Lysobacterales bacterium]
MSRTSLRRVSPTEIRSLRELYPLAPGELLDAVPRRRCSTTWPSRLATTSPRKPPIRVLLQESKSY